MALNQQHTTDEKVTNNSDEDNHKKKYNPYTSQTHKINQMKNCSFLHP